MHRFNEGGCDPGGRFWVGVMFDPVDPASPARRGALHSYTSADELREEPDVAELHNGMAWSVDGSRMFLSHSNRREIRHVAYAGGQVRDKTLFATSPHEDGIPDGAAMAATGARCTAAAACGASIRTVGWTARYRCRSASPRCAASAVPN